MSKTPNLIEWGFNLYIFFIIIYKKNSAEFMSELLRLIAQVNHEEQCFAPPRH